MREAARGAFSFVGKRDNPLCTARLSLDVERAGRAAQRLQSPFAISFLFFPFFFVHSLTARLVDGPADEAATCGTKDLRSRHIVCILLLLLLLYYH